MKVFIYLSVLLITMISCAEKNDYEHISEIRRLEFQRSNDAGVFDKFLIGNNTSLKILVADAIAKIGDPIHQSVLTKMLPENNPALLKKVIFALGQIGNQDSLLFSLLDDPYYQPYDKAVIAALGCSKNESNIPALLERLSGFPDSLKVIAIQNISFLAPATYKNREVLNKLRVYLQSEEVPIRAAAVYFFSRHPHSSALPSLIRMPLESGSIEDKYRLKAISGALNNYYIQLADTALFDSLKQRITSDLDKKILDWQHKLYELIILRNFANEAAYRQAIPYLKDGNPHLRKTAIETLSASDSLEAKQALIKIYPEASWADKGHIIMALSKKYPEMTYPLIQQNLDKGNTYFKQLLLHSLAIIKNRMSLNQLKQFLQVPNTRLKFTAFEELWKLRYIGYEQARGLLLSGDLALSTLAANWITEHPEWALFDDLNAAYLLYNEPTGIEAMVEILKAMALVRDDKTNKFLIDTYQKTHSFTIARQIEKIGHDHKLSLNKRTDLKPLLFVPDTINFELQSINVQMITEKGDLFLKLYPDVAPATVANFVDLANRGFYNNLSFHRVVSDFVIQGGDPRGDGWGGPGYSIPCEYNERSFIRGTLGMATAGKDTGGSQFFICLSEQPHLNRCYTVFGEVTSGLDIVDIIEIDDIIKQIIILK